MLKEKSEFREKRLVFRDPEVAPSLEIQAEREKRLGRKLNIAERDKLGREVRENSLSQLISVLNGPANAGTDFPQPIDPLFTGINSNEIFNDNPFGHYLLNLRVPDYLKLYDDLKHEEGSLELIFNPDNAGKTRRARTRSLGTIRESDGSSDEEVGDYNVGEKEIVATGPMIALKNFKFEGLAYVALIWPRIKAEFFEGLDDNDASEIDVKLALRNLDAYPKLKEYVLALGKKLKSPTMNLDDLAREAANEVNDLKSSVAVKKAPKVKESHLEKLTEKVLADHRLTYSDKVPTLTQLNLDETSNEWLQAMNLRESAFNPTIWDYRSADGLARIRFDAKHGLNLPIEDSPWREVFNELAKASTDNYKAGKFREWFLDPEKYEAELRDNGEVSFLLAYKKFKLWKEELMKVNENQAGVAKALREKGDIPVLSSIVEGTKEQLSLMAKAVRERDWATIAIYGAGILGVYTILKNSKDGSVMGFVKKMLPYLGVAAIGLKIAADNGALEKIGLVSQFASVEGTSLEVLMRMEGVKNQGKVSGETMLSISQIPMSELWKARQGTHASSAGEAPGFIDPMRLAPDVYREMLGSIPGTLDEKRKSKQFNRIGTELFLFSEMVEDAYRQTMFSDHPKYRGIEFKDVMDGELGRSSIIDFAEGLKKYVNYKVDEKGEKEISKRLTAVFSGRDLAMAPLGGVRVKGQDVLSSSIAGLPVIITETVEGYKIFDRSEFEANPKNAKDLLNVPREGKEHGGGTTALDEFESKVKEKAKALIVKAVPAAAASLEWKGSHWAYEKAADPRLVNFGITPPSAVEVKVLIQANGSVEEVETAGGVNDLLLKKLVASKGFETLAPLVKKKMVDVVELGLGGLANQVKLKIADVEVILKFEGGEFKFVTVEKELMKNEKFIEAYIEAWFADETIGLQKELDEIFELIQGANADWTVVLSKLWSGDGAGSPVKGSSVPNHYSKAILDIVKYHALLRMKGSLPAASFTEFSTKVLTTVEDVKARINGVKTNLQAKGNEELSDSEFELRVAQPLMESPCQSLVMRSARVSFNGALYKGLKTLINLSPWDEGTHVKAVEATKIWLHFAAQIDRGDLDKATNKTEVESYLNYLEKEVVSKVRIGKIEMSGIMDFQEWKAQNIAPSPLSSPIKAPMEKDGVKSLLVGEVNLAKARIVERYGDRIKMDAKNAPVFDELIRELNKNLDSTLQTILDKNLSYSAQLMAVNDLVYKKILEPIVDNKDERYLASAGVSGTMKDAAEATSDLIGKASEFVKNITKEVADYVTDGALDRTVLALPPRVVLVAPIGSTEDLLKAMQTFRKLRGNDLYGFDTTSKDNFTPDDLKDTFKNISEAYVNVYNEQEALFQKELTQFEVRVKKTPHLFTDAQKNQFEDFKEELNKLKDQKKTAEILYSYLVKNDHKAFAEYCESKKDKFKF